ncbi:MAG: YegS/Rv2252/BmrU family lipid kinase [Ferruginibacter sp.]
MSVQENKVKILFVVNPVSGPNNTSWEEIIQKYFSERNTAIEIFMLDEKPDEAALEKRIKILEPEKVVAVGGDGTITMVAKIVAKTKCVLGILPAGSANGMARELNIPLDAEEALAVVESGEIKCCDAIKINNKDVCLHLSDIGLNAQLIKYFDEGKVRGKLGYAKVILKTLWHKQKIQVIVQTQNTEVRRNAFMVVLANASKYGTGAVINPLGALDDGAFEVVIVRKLALSELMKMLLKPMPFNPQKIETFSATSVAIETVRSAHFQIDGEYLGKISKLDAKILPDYINIVLPKSNS